MRLSTTNQPIYEIQNRWCLGPNTLGARLAPRQTPQKTICVAAVGRCTPTVNGIRFRRCDRIGSGVLFYQPFPRANSVGSDPNFFAGAIHTQVQRRFECKNNRNRRHSLACESTTIQNSKICRENWSIEYTRIS